MIGFRIDVCISEEKNKYINDLFNSKNKSYGLTNSNFGVQIEWAGTRKCWTLEYNVASQPSMVAFQV